LLGWADIPKSTLTYLADFQAIIPVSIMTIKMHLFGLLLATPALLPRRPPSEDLKFYAFQVFGRGALRRSRAKVKGEGQGQ
jgi:hypothetical protein